MMSEAQTNFTGLALPRSLTNSVPLTLNLGVFETVIPVIL